MTTWSVQPSSADGPDRRPWFDYAVDPGEVLTDYVGVSNLGREPLTVDLYATDAFMTDDGSFSLLASDQPPTNVGAWVEFGARTLTIPPQTRLDVPFRLHVPDDAEPGDHAGGIVASVETPATDAEGNVVVYDRRVGSRIYLHVNGETQPSLAITGLEASYDSGWNPIAGTLVVRFTVTNTGNVRLAAGQEVSAAGPLGLWHASLDLDDLPELLPGSSIVATNTFTDVPPVFNITTDVLLSPYPTASGVSATAAPVSASVSTLALPILLAGLLLLGGEALYLLMRRRRQRAAAARGELEAALAAAVAAGIEIGRGEKGSSDGGEGVPDDE